MNAIQAEKGADLTQDHGLAAEPTPHHIKVNELPPIETKDVYGDGTYILFNCPEANIRGYMVGASKVDVHVVEYVEGAEDFVDRVLNDEALDFFEANSCLYKEVDRKYCRLRVAGAAGKLGVA